MRPSRGRGPFLCSPLSPSLFEFSFSFYNKNKESNRGVEGRKPEGRLCGRGHPEFTAGAEGEASARARGTRLPNEQRCPLRRKPAPVSEVG